MDSSTMRRALRPGLICLSLLFATLAAAQELQPMAVQPSLAPAGGGRHKLYVTLGNRTNLGMDNVKVTVVTSGGETQFGALTTLNPYQWQTVNGTVDSDEGVVITEYVFNDKAQRLSVALNAGGVAGAGRGMPPLLWLGGAALLGAFVTLAGAAVGRRGR